MPRVHVNGINISYKIQGRGEPLVLIMGFSLDQLGWMFQAGAFGKHYRVVTFDNRGVGKTDKPGGAYTMKMMADDTVGLMEHLDIRKAHIVGASMGGMIAQEIAVSCPEKVDKLVLGCTFARRDDSGGLSPDFPRALGFPEDYTDEDARSVPVLRAVDTLYSLSIARPLYRIALIPMLRLKARLNGTTGLTGQLEAILSHDTFDRLKEIAAPTLVITGTQDRAIAPTSSDVLANSIPGAKLVKVDGGSHAFWIEKRREFNREVLGFLRGG